MAVYSFQDVAAAFNGPSGSFQLASGAAAGEGGISIEPVEDANVMVTGAGGAVMHNRIASTASTVTARLLKTSPVNAQLMNAFNAQRASSLLHGRNGITLSDAIRGDFVVCREVAFGRTPTMVWGKTGEEMEWVFHAGHVEAVLGSGVPEL